MKNCGTAVIASFVAICAGQPQMSQEPQPKLVRQDRSENHERTTTFRSQTDLAFVNFTFLPSKHGRPDELKPADISIREDGILRPAASLEGGRLPRTIPTGVVLLFDCGRSFRGSLNPQLLPPGMLDELENVRISIYGFNDFVYRLIQPSRNMTELQKAMKELSRVPYDGVPMSDPIIQAMRSAAAVPGSRPRIMIVFSGGASRVCQMPRVDAQETVRVAQELGIALYPVAVQPQPPATQDASVSGHKAFHNPVPPSRTFAPAREFLSLGPATGGKSFARFSAPSKVFAEVFQHAYAQASGEYVAGFYPSTDGSTKSHNVQVILKEQRQGEILGGVRTLVQ